MFWSLKRPFSGVKLREFRGEFRGQYTYLLKKEGYNMYTVPRFRKLNLLWWQIGKSGKFSHLPETANGCLATIWSLASGAWLKRSKNNAMCNIRRIWYPEKRKKNLRFFLDFTYHGCPKNYKRRPLSPSKRKQSKRPATYDINRIPALPRSSYI